MPSLNIEAIISFLTIGIIVGVILRIIAKEIYSRRILAISNSYIKIFLTLAVIILIITFPDTFHKIHTSFWLIGVGVGLLMHQSYRTRKDSLSEIDRRRQTVAHMIYREQKKNKKIPERESNIIELFSENRMRKAKRKIEEIEKEDTLPEILSLIKSLMQRKKGDYSGALNAIEIVLKKKSKHVVHFYIMKALALGELGRRSEMYTFLLKALKEDKKCVLTRITLGLRLSEDKADRRRMKLRNKDHLNEVWQALRLNVKQKLPFEFFDPRRIIMKSVPINWTFLLDAYAYALLVSGDKQLSRTLLSVCIYEDPNFSSPYMHLGEWFIRILEKEKSDLEIKMKAKEMAEFCLWIAFYLEKKKESLIKKRSRRLIKKLEKYKLL